MEALQCHVAKTITFFHCVIIKKSSNHTLQGWTPHHLTRMRSQHSAMACGVNYSGHWDTEHQNDPICNSVLHTMMNWIILLPTHSGTLKGAMILASWSISYRNTCLPKCTFYRDWQVFHQTVILPVQLASKSKGYGFSENFSIVVAPATPYGSVVYEAGSLQEHFLQGYSVKTWHCAVQYAQQS